MICFLAARKSFSTTDRVNRVKFALPSINRVEHKTEAFYDLVSFVEQSKTR